MKNDEHISNNNSLSSLPDIDKLYKNLYFLMKEGVAIFRMIYDKNGREIDLFLIDINPTIEKHFKASGKDIRGKKLSKILNKKDIPFLNICKRVIKSGVPESFEDHSINPDKFYKISIIPGQNDFFAVIFDDISQSKQHEEDLRLSEEKYRLIVENANDGILISQSDEFIYNNTKFADILGYHPYEFEHISFKEIYTKEGILDLLDRNHKREKGEKVPNYYETTFKKKDGSVIKVDVNYQIINYRNMPATFAIVRDITQQEQAKKDIQNALKKAEESDRLKSAFLANMSHEIRTPMNGIMGFSKLLRKKDISSEKHKEYLDVIEHSSNRMLNLINDLIDISKLEAGQVRVYNSLFNVSNLFDYLESFFSPECKAKKIKLKKYCNNKLSIYTDKDKLEAVLSNLIKNAIKFTDQGQIKFACEKKFDSLLFYVEDTGIGIPEDKQNEIFSRFVQADDRISKPYEGAGLGLSISKAFIELMGGKIELLSEQGSGSKFYFSLPLANETELHAPGSLDHETKGKDTSKLNILVAEDDQPSYLYLTIILENFAENITWAKNGKEAVEYCKKHPELDLIMMDLKMPEIDGYEATKLIREFNKDIPILAQTAYAFDDDHEKIIQSGFNGHLTKPIQENEVKKLLLELFQ